MSPSSSGMPRMFLFWLCAAAARVTPTFLKTCTWAPTGPAKVTAVTVNLQTTAFYDGAKQTVMNKQMAMKVAAAAASVVKPVTVGETGTTTSLATLSHCGSRRALCPPRSRSTQSWPSTRRKRWTSPSPSRSRQSSESTDRRSQTTLKPPETRGRFPIEDPQSGSPDPPRQCQEAAAVYLAVFFPAAAISSSTLFIALSDAALALSASLGVNSATGRC